MEALVIFLGSITLIAATLGFFVISILLIFCVSCWT